MSDQDPRPRAVFESRRFTVVRPLGEGGMGAVYEVVDHERQARVALKTLRHLSPEWVERLKHEFRSLQDLHHPNLVSLLELVEEQGHWGFTMELLHGCNFLEYVWQPAEPTTAEASGHTETLDVAASHTLAPEPSEAATQLLSQRLSHSGRMVVEPAAREVPTLPAEPIPSPPRFDEGRLRAALAQLARGLHALHGAGKVHRDIKPSNLLVTESGRVVLLDFGVLADVREGSVWGRTVVGTSAYVAPEQVEGAPPSPAADWYSVGALLYQCLTGERPFTGDLHQVLHAKRSMEPAPPQARVAGLPEDLCQLCVELLRRDSARRPAGEQVLQRLGVEPALPVAGTAGVELPFVGRQQELAALHAALADSRQRAGVAVRVEGESGVGKTRLVRHFLGEVRRQHPQALVLQGRCHERESMPYKGVEGLVEGLARWLTARGEAAVQALRPTGASALVWLFPVLGRAPGLGGDSESTPGGEDLLGVRVRAFLALRELLARLAGQAPVLLAVEDLQWADGDGLALLEELGQAPGVLRVATLRMGSGEPSAALERVRSWNEARRLTLQGLPPEEARELAERLLGEEGRRHPEHAARIAEESSGQPLFVDALVRHRRAGGVEAPLDLEEVLWALAGQLEPAARRLLELLTVAGRPLPQSVAAHATACDFAEYLRQASALRSAHLALTSGPSGVDTVELVHDRLRRAVARHMEDGQRREWHMRLACSLEALGLGEAATLARHWLGAGQAERAAALYLQAARQAGAALAFSQEAALYGLALGLGRFERAERCELLVARAEALARAGTGAEAAAAFLVAAEQAGEAEAHVLRRRAAEQYLSCGQVEQGLALVRQVLAEAGLRYPESTLEALATILRHRLALALRPLRLRPRAPGQVPAALQRRMDACWELGNVLTPIEVVRGFSLLSCHLRLALQSGDTPRMLRACTAEALFIAATSPRNRPRIARLMARLEPLSAQGMEDPFLRCYLHFGRMAEPYCIGQVPQARAHLERALELLPQVRGEHWLRVLLWTLWGELMALEGGLEPMHQRLAGPVAEARERGDLNALVGLQVGYPTLGWLARGEPEQGRQVAQAALAAWPAGGWFVQHFKHLQALSYVDLYQGQGEAVLRRLELHLRAARRALPITAVRCVSLDLRSRALLLEAGRRRGSEARRLLRAAEADARRLEREGMLYTQVQALLVRAGVALQRGQGEQALSVYARAAEEAQAQGLRLYAQVARWREAELRGGEERRSRLSALREELRAQGLQRPEAMVALYCPGPAWPLNQ